MLLSKLVYFCIKNAVFYDDSAFTYEAFLQGKYDSDPDYATNIHNIYSPLNMAIARLNDLNRLPFAIDVLTRRDEKTFETTEQIKTYLTSEGVKFKTGENLSSYYNVHGIEYNVDTTRLTVEKVQSGVFDINISSYKEIMGIAAIDRNGYVRPLQFIAMHGTDKIKILSPVYPDEQIEVEYKRSVPYFVSYKDAAVNELTDALNVENGWIAGEVFFHYAYSPTLEKWYKTADPEMKNYGIDDGMTNFIIEYVKGCLLEPVDAHLAVMHLNRAESYFNNLPVQICSFNQRQTEVVYSIGE